MQKEAWDLNTDKKKKQADFAVDPTTFAQDEIVFRVMTFEHIPDERVVNKTQRLSQTTK